MPGTVATVVYPQHQVVAGPLVDAAVDVVAVAAAVVVAETAAISKTRLPWGYPLAW